MMKCKNVEIDVINFFFHQKLIEKSIKQFLKIMHSGELKANTDRMKQKIQEIKKIHTNCRLQFKERTLNP